MDEKSSRKRKCAETDSTDKKKSRKGDELKTWRPCDVLSSSVGLQPEQVLQICNLLDEGNSIPFISRYRVNVTGGMKPDDIRNFQEKYETLKTVQEKSEKLLQRIEKAGKMSFRLKYEVAIAKTLEEIDVLAAPFKPDNQGTLASRARKNGLEIPAKELLEDRWKSDLATLIDERVSGRKTITEIESGIKNILVDVIAHSKETLDYASSKSDKANLYVVSSKAKETKAALAKKTAEKVDDAKYDRYFKFSCPATSLRSHQVLALNRGEKKKVLSVKVDFSDAFEKDIQKFCSRQFGLDRTKSALRKKLLNEAIKEGVKKFVLPWLSRRLRSRLSQEAEKASIQSFCSNLRNMLLEPPNRDKIVMGIDPGFRHGCKLAVVSSDGRILYTGKIYPHAQNSHQKNDYGLLVDKIVSLEVDIIAIGNGVGCRETEEMISKLIKSGDLRPKDVTYTITSEQGASIYSCSDLALKENPSLDPSVLGAVTIARRVLDPLAEYVKVDPWHLGVGMYQLDLSHARLKKSTESVVEECVSFVGVDLNYAPVHILKSIAGIGDSIAKNIVEWRAKNGRFERREQLKKIRGIASGVYQQLAGFVRIYPTKENRGAANTEPFDALLIHPESYPDAKALVKAAGFQPADLGTQRLIAYFKRQSCKTSTVDTDPQTLRLITEALSQPFYCDLRQGSTGAIFRRDIVSLADLRPGVVLEGRVMNVVDFGAFVDVGVGVNGLVHSSKMRGFELRLGQRVRIKVLDLNVPKRHLALNLEEVIRSG